MLGNLLRGPWLFSALMGVEEIQSVSCMHQHKLPVYLLTGAQQRYDISIKRRGRLYLSENPST